MGSSLAISHFVGHVILQDLTPVLYVLISGMAKMFGHLGFKRPLDQSLGELLEYPVLAYQVFGFLVVSQNQSMGSDSIDLS